MMLGRGHKPRVLTTAPAPADGMRDVHDRCRKPTRTTLPSTRKKLEGYAPQFGQLCWHTPKSSPTRATRPWCRASDDLFSSARDRVLSKPPFYTDLTMPNTPPLLARPTLDFCRQQKLSASPWFSGAPLRETVTPLGKRWWERAARALGATMSWWYQHMLSLASMESNGGSCGGHSSMNSPHATFFHHAPM